MCHAHIDAAIIDRSVALLSVVAFADSTYSAFFDYVPLKYWEQVRDVLYIPEDEQQPFWWMPEYSNFANVHQCLLFVERLGATMGVYG
jgi:hypothetical protein